MTYSLDFDARALKEWQKLGDTVRQQLKKKLVEILNNPRVEAKEAPINLPRGGGKSKFPRDAALFAKKRPMLRVLRAISSALPC